MACCSDSVTGSMGTGDVLYARAGTRQRLTKAAGQGMHPQTKHTGAGVWWRASDRDQKLYHCHRLKTQNHPNKNTI
eukprot:5995431-Amphidinium_carterae.1